MSANDNLRCCYGRPWTGQRSGTEKSMNGTGPGTKVSLTSPIVIQIVFELSTKHSSASEIHIIFLLLLRCSNEMNPLRLRLDCGVHSLSPLCPKVLRLQRPLPLSNHKHLSSGFQLLGYQQASSSGYPPEHVLRFILPTNFTARTRCSAGVLGSVSSSSPASPAVKRHPPSVAPGMSAPLDWDALDSSLCPHDHFILPLTRLANF